MSLAEPICSLRHTLGVANPLRPVLYRVEFFYRATGAICAASQLPVLCSWSHGFVQVIVQDTALSIRRVIPVALVLVLIEHALESERSTAVD